MLKEKKENVRKEKKPKGVKIELQYSNDVCKCGYYKDSCPCKPLKPEDYEPLPTQS